MVKTSRSASLAIPRAPIFLLLLRRQPPSSTLFPYTTLFRSVRALAASVGTVLNLELGAAPEIVRIASRIAPFQATLVPERRQEITTEGGLALHGANRKVGAAVRRRVDAGIRDSRRIDPDRATR